VDTHHTNRDNIISLSSLLKYIPAKKGYSNITKYHHKQGHVLRYKTISFPSFL